MRAVILASLCLLCLPVRVFASEAEVLALLKPVGDATLRGDYAAALDLMYEPAMADLGGRPAMLKAIATVKETMSTQGMRLLRYEYKRPFRFIAGTKQRYVVVPTVTELEFPLGIIRAEAFELGVEVSPGKWQFLNSSTLTRETIAKYFPDFPAKEKLPEPKQEIISNRK